MRYGLNREYNQIYGAVEYMEYLSPFNVKGTKFVVERMIDPYEEDLVNTYLPTERRVRRFSAKERADHIMGMNGTFDASNTSLLIVAASVFIHEGIYSNHV